MHPTHRARRTGATVGGFALAVLVATLAGCGDRSGTPAEGSADAVRWVGEGRVVVAVPRWWTTGETRCLVPVETTVYADSGAVVDCVDPPTPAEVAEVSSLAVLDAGTGHGEALVARMRPDGEVDGREVLALDGCDEWLEGTCRRVFAVPSEGVVLAVTLADAADGDLQEIRASLRVLPGDERATPLGAPDLGTPSYGSDPATVRAYVGAVERAGFAVEVVTAGPPADDAPAAGAVSTLPSGSLLDVDPQPGTPLGIGGLVTLTVAGAG